ncbi:hypothetical protein BDV41DRAFT_543271 [Aspergillus transmontanensis]|uniref:Uncharacterized protein n=1 Tax=Aspergillus transmontanensis TaxID=1034304 RepID=A0A5N6VR32_9EURO|nr:hypothetical protein BDV41DRAFT_543271 [Aspergillus transmontanensis]
MWDYLFIDKTWLNIAETYDRCLPLLIGRNLSAFQPHTPQRHYCALIVNDYSGDLRQHEDKLFASLREGWVYNKCRYEISFPCGIIMNIREVITGQEEVGLPLDEMFSEDRSGLHLEYCFYRDRTLKSLTSQDIIGLNGPAHRKKAIKHGCSLKLLYKGQSRQCILEPVNMTKKIWVDKWDGKGMISSWTKTPGKYRARVPPFLNDIKR